MESPPAADDTALIQGTLAGRREDFDVLVERYQRPLYAFAFRFVHDHEQAADIVQTTFVQAYSHLAQFAGRASFKTWLHQIALNECRALRRTEQRRHVVPLDDVSEAALADASAGNTSQPSGWKTVIERLVGRLPLRQRAVVTLRIFSDLPFKDIARIENITENSAKVNYHHAIARLRQWMAESESES